MKKEKKKQKSKELLTLENELKTFTKKINDLDIITDNDTKAIIDPLVGQVGIVFVMQSLYKYFGVNSNIIDKINLKSPVNAIGVK